MRTISQQLLEKMDDYGFKPKLISMSDVAFYYLRDEHLDSKIFKDLFRDYNLSLWISGTFYGIPIETNYMQEGYEGFMLLDLYKEYELEIPGGMEMG